MKKNLGYVFVSATLAAMLCLLAAVDLSSNQNLSIQFWIATGLVLAGWLALIAVLKLAGRLGGRVA